MFDTIVMYIENGMMAVMVLMLYSYLITSVYPRLTMRTVWKADRRECGDRGVRKLSFSNGRAIVYEPIPKFRRYIRRYALIKQDGCTYIKCRIHDRVAFLRYDVVSFDRRGRLLDVLSISERITEGGHTRSVRLPRHTAYAYVTPRQVDDMYTGHDITVGYSMVGIAVYAALSALTAAAVACCLRTAFARILSTLPLEGNVSKLSTTVIFAAILGVGNAAWIVYRYRVHAHKVMNR